jgi:hypothetical protein
MCMNSILNHEMAKMVLSDFVFPIALGILAYIASDYISTRRTRKRQSLLGAAVLSELIEEVNHGISVLQQIDAMLNGQSQLIGDMPRKSWSGMATISDDVLERILCTTTKSDTVGFPASEIRSHLKNYFDHMCPNIDSVTAAIRSGGQWQNAARTYLVNGRYIEAATGVLAMLKHVKILLESNYKRLLPK